LGAGLRRLRNLRANRPSGKRSSTSHPSLVEIVKSQATLRPVCSVIIVSNLLASARISSTAVPPAKLERET